MQKPQIKWKIVTTVEQFAEATAKATTDIIALDVETKGNNPLRETDLLIGLSLSFKVQDGTIDSIYIPYYAYDKFKCALTKVNESFKWTYVLVEFITSKKLVGFNSPYDKSWVDHRLDVITDWKADVRTMWRLSDTKDTRHRLSLEEFQLEILKWEDTSKNMLEEQVKNRGGKLKKGDHYLANLETLAEYACYDTYSTLEGYYKLAPFFDEHDYWFMLDRTVDYAEFINEYSLTGIPLNKKKLVSVFEKLRERLEVSENSARETLKEYIDIVEREKAQQKADKWTATCAEKNKDKAKAKAEAYMADPTQWEKFNFGSPQQKRQVIFDLMKAPVMKKSKKTGAASTSKKIIRLLKDPKFKPFVEIAEIKENIKTVKGLLESCTDDNMIHPKFDASKQLTARLSGLKPNFLNLPFREESIMGCFELPKEYEGGLAADFTSVEPCISAHFTEDPGMLKVFRDGLGDVYLDLCLVIFKEDKEFAKEYNPNVPLDPAIKSKYKHLRDIAKVIELALSYTGTEHTVYNNLRLSGMTISKEECRKLVARYRTAREKVADFEYRLKSAYQRNGSIRNLTGRVIQISERKQKDLYNRFLQSGGHDVLVMWVNEIRKEVAAKNIMMRPWLPDIHDATVWMYGPGEEQVAIDLFNKALRSVNNQLQLDVPIRAEIKKITTLAGVK